MKKIYYLLITLAISSLSFGQGNEDFANSNATSSYASDSFTGNNSVTWSYVASRDAASTAGVTVPAIMLRQSSSNSKISSSTISGGIGNFSVKLYKGFTGAGTRQVELFVNGVSKGTSVGFDNYDEQTFAIDNINVAGDITIEIVNTTANQVIIDDISWTAFQESPVCTASEGFETFPLVDWTLSSSNTSNSITQSSTWANSGSNSLRFSSYSSASTYDQYAVTPQLVTTSGDQTISFYYKSSNGSELFKVGTSSTGDDVATDFTWSDEIVSSTTAAQYSISDLPVGTTYVAIHYYSNFQYRMYVDDFCMPELYVPDCLTPTDLEVADITNNSVNLSWTAGGTETDYEYVIQDAGTGEPTGAGIAVTGATTVTVNTLTAATDYEIYVRSNCDANGFSAWVGPETFTTEPAPIVPDYTNNFSTYPGENWSEGTGETSPSGTTSGWFSVGFGNVGTTGSAGVNIYDTGGDEWLITPTFDLSSGGYEINLDVALTDYYSTDADVIGSDDAVYLMQSTDNGVNWTTLLTWDADNSPSNTGDNVTVDISTLTSATTKFALFMLEGTSSGGDINFYVDNFSVRTPPSCFSPQSNSLSVANVTNSSVDISWAQGGTETDYQYVIQDAGTGEPTLAGIAVTGATTVTVNTLISATDYEIYVRSNCGTNGFSAWTGPLTFTTAYSCGDTLYDSGGATGDYANDELTTVTVYPDTAGDLVTFTFLSFETEANYDEIWVYDGPDTNATVILDEYSGSTIPDPITSSHPTGALTFVFDSDVSSTRSGYEILTSCSTPLGMDTVSKSKFTYFPNPVNNVLSIKAQASIDSITVYNMLGQTIVKSTPNTTTTAVDMSGLQTGAYFVQVAINNSIETVRVIKN